MYSQECRQTSSNKLNNIAALAAILFTTCSISLSAFTYPELYPRSLGGSANDIDSFKSGIFYIKIQQPGKSIPINNNKQLDKKEFYQAIQKYGEQAKTDGTSTGNVAVYLQKATNTNFPESIALQSQLKNDNYAVGTATCSTFPTTGCNSGYVYDNVNKSGYLTTAANYATDCCKLSINYDGSTNNSNTSAVPVMTSNTTCGTPPCGLAFQSSIHSAPYTAYNVFNNILGGSTFWITPDNTTTGFIGYKFNSAKIINKYMISTYSIAWPTAWTFQGSNDTTTGADGSWTNIGNPITNGVQSPVLGYNTYTVTNSTAYIAYRLNITASQFIALYVDDIKFIEAQ